jgi:peptide/nickel transport system substrate-binding protein
VPNLTLERDYEAANALLEDAGYTDSDGDGVRETPDGTKMSYEVVAWAEEPDMIRAADLLVEWGAEIGIELRTAATETNAAVDLVWPGFNRGESGPAPFDLAVWNWSAGVLNVPSQALQLFYHSDVVLGRLNVDFYESDEMDGLLTDLAATTDPAERLDLMAQVQELAYEDLPFIVLWYPVDTFAFNSSVYDGWRVVDGLGIINKLSFLPQVYP